jgi:hypothetical protein
MYIELFDRCDRLGANISTYIAQILYAHNNNCIIKFRKNSKKNYRYENSIFVQILFNYIDEYNTKLRLKGINADVLDNDIECSKSGDYIYYTSSVLKNIKSDFISYFHKHVYTNIEKDITNIQNKYNYIPFDTNKTILVHLRLDDVSNRLDYDGSICSEYYRQKIVNNEVCKCEFYDTINNQAPLSKKKLENIINKAKAEFPDYKVILLSSPISDTSFFDYDVIKNNDESLDLYLLSMCNVSILSRSTYALSSTFFNNKKLKTYIPLWGHFVTCGLDTIYDKNDKSKFEYFY